MKVASILGLALALIATPTASAPAPDAGPDPGSIHIKSITYGGSGCPQGSAAIQLSGGGANVTMAFERFVASTGPGIPMTERRKNCQLNVNIRHPTGFQYSILSIDYSGYAEISDGNTGTLRSLCYFSGSTQQTITQSVIHGPFNGDYVRRITVDTPTWSPCGSEGALNINSALLTGNSTKSGQSIADSVGLRSLQNLYLQWREC